MSKSIALYDMFDIIKTKPKRFPYNPFRKEEIFFMRTAYRSNNYLCCLSIYIRLHRFIRHEPNWSETKTKSSFTLWCIMDGNIWLETSNTQRRLSCGDAILFYPGTAYRAYTDEAGCSFLFFIFSYELGNNIDVLSSENLAGIYHSEEVAKRTRQFITRYITDFHERNTNMLKLYAFFMDYLADLLQLSSYLLPFNERPAAPDDSLIHSIMEYIHNHCTENITIPELAKLADMPEKSFIRYFHSNVGISPKRYANECRMKYAAELLTDERKSVASIADELGYSDQYSFSKAFHKYYGDSPSMFRKAF